VWSSIRAATEEISIMFFSATALRRQIRMGGLQLLKGASEGHGTKVRLLIPDDADGHKLSVVINELKLQCPHVTVRSMEKSLRTRITIVLSDRSERTIIELKDDTKDIS
jgi:hypothetical protein